MRRLLIEQDRELRDRFCGFVLTTIIDNREDQSESTVESMKAEANKWVGNWVPVFRAMNNEVIREILPEFDLYIRWREISENKHSTKRFKREVKQQVLQQLKQLHQEYLQSEVVEWTEFGITDKMISELTGLKRTTIKKLRGQSEIIADQGRKSDWLQHLTRVFEKELSERVWEQPKKLYKIVVAHFANFEVSDGHGGWEPAEIEPPNYEAFRQFIHRERSKSGKVGKWQKS